MKDTELSSYLRSLVVGTETKVPLKNGGNVTAINFDNAATTPPFFSVMKEIEDFAPWYSSIHRGKGYKSVLCSDLYEKGREVVREFVNADPERDTIIFTKNTTESINMLAYTLFQQDKEQVILSTEMEHLANELPWRCKFKTDFVETDQEGKLSLRDLQNKLVKYKGKVKLVTVTGASNVTGYINPIYKIARLAHRYGAKILVDAAQLIPHAAVDMKPYDSPEHIDYLVFSAHKMYAPFGIGTLIGPKETFANTEPVYQGGGCVRLVSRQFIEWDIPPYRDETGTPNVMGVAALIKAIETLKDLDMKVIHQYEKDLINYTIEKLKTIPGITLYGHADQGDEKVSLICFNVQGIHHSLLSEMLCQEAGIAVRSGFFCAHPYCEKLLGLTTKELEYYRKNPDAPLPGMVRISFGLYNNYAEIDTFMEKLKMFIKRKRYYANKYKRILARKSYRQRP